MWVLNCTVLTVGITSYHVPLYLESRCKLSAAVACCACALNCCTNVNQLQYGLCACTGLLPKGTEPSIESLQQHVWLADHIIGKDFLRFSAVYCCGCAWFSLVLFRLSNVNHLHYGLCGCTGLLP